MQDPLKMRMKNIKIERTGPNQKQEHEKIDFKKRDFGLKCQFNCSYIIF